MNLSETQKRALRILWRHAQKGQGERQIAGYGNAGLLSACNALRRKGLAGSHRTGHFYITKEGEPIGRELVAEFDAQKRARDPQP